VNYFSDTTGENYFRHILKPRIYKNYMNLLYHNLIGVFAIVLGFYFLLKDYKILTIFVGAIGLAVVFYGMKLNMPKAVPNKLVSKKKK